VCGGGFWCIASLPCGHALISLLDAAEFERVVLNLTIKFEDDLGFFGFHGEN